MIGARRIYESYLDELARLGKPNGYANKSAIHTALAVRFEVNADYVRAAVSRWQRKLNANTGDGLHVVEKQKTVNFSDYVAQVDDLPLEDDTPKVHAALRVLKSLGRHIRILILSDEHFDDHDERAVTMNIRIAAASRPDLIVFNGDTFDLGSVSQYSQDRRAPSRDALSVIRKPYTAYVRALHAAAPNAYMLFIDGNHNERIETFTNANASQFGDTIEQAYADLVRQGGRVLWLNGKQEIDIFGHHVMHGERASKNAAGATLENDFGGGQPLSGGHIHKIQKVYKRVKKQGEDRWIIVTACFAGFAGNNPPAYVKRKRDQIHWIQACQLVHVNPHGDDVHINEIPFHESVDGGLIAVCGIEVLTVNAASAAATKAA